ncbi:unnamed protein product [Blepharisma stoltei]|uniref:Uncharacterized protein n=1 Tax=Blepharisma stoltei TaxID=1481888 RepID=A0AAU9J9M6_9CILI|nr:unnamed protein product [Blepharisma stoltei]
MLVVFLLIVKWATCLGFSVEEEFVKTVEGCPGLYINDNIRLLNEPTVYTKYSQTIDVYIKKLLDLNQVIRLLEPYIHESLLIRYKQVTNNDRQGSLILFPSAVWLPEKHLYLATARISLFGMYNFLYATFYDSEWNEVTKEDYVGRTKVPGIIPITIKQKEEGTGPEDPRLFVALNNEIFVVFNLLGKDKNRMIHLYRFSTATFRMLYLDEHNGKKNIIEKNWTPLIIDNEHLYFVYNFKNLQVVDCTAENESCKKMTGNYDSKPEALRGGSPFVRFEDTNYYVSLSYTHIFLKNCNFYRPVLVVIEVMQEQLSLKMVYQSEPFDLKNRILMKPVTTYRYLSQIRDCMLIIPSSIASWNFKNNTADLHVTIEDQIPIVVRVEGFTDFVQYVINMYEYGRLPENANCAAKLSVKYFLSDSPRKAY